MRGRKRHRKKTLQGTRRHRKRILLFASQGRTLRPWMAKISLRKLARWMCMEGYSVEFNIGEIP